MILTQERSEVLANYLLADNERAQRLLEMSPEDAAKAINADGNDFTVEEVKEFGKQLQTVAAKPEGELSTDDLNDVSGGAFISLAALAMGAGIGYVIGRMGW